MKRLLRDKEHRLCSTKYGQNDREMRRRNALRPESSDVAFHDFLGHFVYPDDAHDLKRHPFFRGIDWEHLHQMKPPDVPKVKDNEDTRYFDQEPSVSDFRETSSSIMSEDEYLAQEELERRIREVYEQEQARVRVQHGADGPGVNEEDFVAAAQNVLDEGLKAKIRAKRPRDRILRDRSVAREALELRKRGAFLGYTYRRPRHMLEEPVKEKESRFKRPQFPGLAVLSRLGHRPASQG